MRIGLVCYCLGIWVGTLLHVSVLQYSFPLLLFCFFAFATVAFFVLSKYFKPASLSFITARFMLFSLAFLIGISWHGVWAFNRLTERLPFEFENEDLIVVGKVVGLPQRTDRMQKFEFIVDAGSSVVVTRKLQLNYFGNEVIRGGQTWEFVVRLKQPRGFSNVGGFDFEAWALQNRISATGYVRTDSEKLVRDGRSARERLRILIKEYFAAGSSGGIVLALTVGDKNAISADLWRLFNATGTNHLWVISGLHIGLLTGLVFFLARFLFRNGPDLLLRLPVLSVSAVLAIIAACGYAYLAVFSLSTQRALVMIVAVLGSQFANRKLSWNLRVLVALVVILSLNPLAIMNPGFWFSFLAVASLLLFTETNSIARGMLGNQAATQLSRIKATINMQFRISLALLLPLSFWFGKFSFVSPLINLVAIPVVSLLVVPLCLLLIPMVFISSAVTGFIILIIDFIIGNLFLGLRLLQEAFPWDLLVGSVVSNSLVVVLAALGLILILMPLGAKRKLFCLPLLLPLLIPVQHEIENGGLVITVFDVGQGLAVLLKTKSHALLYDTAAGIDEQINIANSVIIPSLQKAGIGRIDKLVISHGDNDHSGGVSAILDKLSVGVVYGSDSVTIPVSSDFQLNSCVRGLDWIWDEVRFQFLNPGSVFNDANNNSCVLRVSAANGSVLLPGDIELEAEIELSARYRELLASEVLIAPHHGSQSSSSYAFIKQVQPRFVVYSSGYKNQFAHPAAAVETKYASYDAIGFSTAATGMLKFDMSNGESTTYVHSHRHENQKYWRHQACAESADMFREPLN